MGDKTSDMSGDPLAFEERFHGSGGESDIDLFAQEAKRNAVVVLADFDVIVDIDGGQFPLGVLVRFFGKWFCIRTIEEIKKLAAGLL